MLIAMIVSGATTFRTLLRENVRTITTAVALVAAIEAINAYREFIDISLQRSVFSMAALGLLTTALSIFLVFRVNEAYARWWEARTLWGGIVNASRTLARQITSLLEVGAIDFGDAAREIVYRHLAYINALRIHLRQEEDYRAIAEFISPEEFDALETAVNKPAQLVQRQGQRVAHLREAGAIDGFGHLMLDASLTELYALQAGCERIKFTVFPDRVAYFTRVVSWAMAVLIPICVIEADGRRLDFLDFLIIPAMMLAFIITERLGAELKNPFEGKPNDTPMTALCRIIEIDMRQQLGERALPAPATPERGVLM